MTLELTETEAGITFTVPRAIAEKIGLTNKAELTVDGERIVLQKPAPRRKLSFEEAAARSDEKFANAYRELAK